MEIPFFLQLPADCASQKATIANGDERIPVACERHGRQVTLDFPVYGTRIAATLLDAGTLEGSWIRTYLPPSRQRMAFAATPIASPEPALRFGRGGAAPSAVDVSGIWRIQFEASGPAKGIFKQASGVVNGTAEVPSEYGDLRFLAGTLDHQRLSLSSFDGQHAYLLQGHAQPDGSLAGRFICCDEERDSFVARRSDDFQVVDPLRQVQVISGGAHLDLTELRDPKYDGKAVIIELFGTWCPNCNDLAPLLRELYDEHGAEGLEMIGLAYELTTDAEYTQERLAAYRRKHGLSWDLVVARSDPGDLFAEGGVKLSSIEGVPVTIFLNRDRTIHAVYAGFSGPATGAEHVEAANRFRALTNEILASR